MVFVRTSTRRNQDGTRVSYLQLAHNEWDPTAKTSRTKVLYSFGRADQLDRAAVERLITALTRVVGVEAQTHRRQAAQHQIGVVGAHAHAEPPKSLIQLLGGAPSGAGSRQMYQSRFGLSRALRASANQGCWSEV